MLQTVQSKSDAGSQIQVAKEKDPATEALAGGLQTFFAQFMAVMPPQQQPAPTFQPAESSARSGRTTAPARAAQEGSRTSVETERSPRRPEALAPLARNEEGKPATEATEPVEPKRPGTQADEPGSATESAASKPTQPLKDASQDAASPNGNRNQGQPQTTPEPSATSATPQNASAAAKAGAPDGMSAAKAQAALEQLLPGNRVSFQFGDQATQPTSKPALSEFMQQLKVEIQSPVFAGAATSPEAPLGQATNTPPPILATLPAMLTASEAAQLAQGQPSKQGSGTSTSGAGTIYPAEGVGAGAAPGAHSAVRVSAPTASEPSLAARRESPMAQVDSSVRWLIKNKEQSAELQLHPEALGRVQIKLTVEGTEVHAKLWASEAAALPVLQEHRALLESSLKAQGLTLGSFDLQQGHQSDQAPLPTPEPASQPLPRIAALETTGQEAPVLQATSHANGHRIEIVA